MTVRTANIASSVPDNANIPVRRAMLAEIMRRDYPIYSITVPEVSISLACDEMNTKEDTIPVNMSPTTPTPTKVAVKSSFIIKDTMTIDPVIYNSV